MLGNFISIKHKHNKKKYSWDIEPDGNNNNNEFIFQWNSAMKFLKLENQIQ